MNYNELSFFQWLGLIILIGAVAAGISRIIEAANTGKDPGNKVPLLSYTANDKTVFEV